MRAISPAIPSSVWFSPTSKCVAFSLLNVALLQNDAAGGGDGHRGVFSPLARRSNAALRPVKNRSDRSDRLARGRGRRISILPSRFSTFSRSKQSQAPRESLTISPSTRSIPT